MSSTAAINPQEFRRALGNFATGVTIITTRAEDGSEIGLTCSSFNSVSLNPPLVLWSLENNAKSLPVFLKKPNWAVHVLASDQEALSTRFARRGEDKFSGLDLETGVGDVPLLTGCTARFQCRTAFQYDGGDHTIFVGEVLSFDSSERPPLVFHGGKYAHATRRDAPDTKPRSAYLAGSFGEDFLGYLLGRSHFRFFAQIRPHLAEMQLSDEEFYVLSALTLKRSMTIGELTAGMDGVLDDSCRKSIDALVKRGLAYEVAVVAEAQSPEYQLTEEGRACALKLISASKAVESHVLEAMGEADAPVLKSLLNRLLSVIDPAAAVLWEDRNRRK